VAQRLGGAGLRNRVDIERLANLLNGDAELLAATQPVADPQACRGTRSKRACTASRSTAVDVGLLGLQIKTSRVAAVTSAAIAPRL